MNFRRIMDKYDAAELARNNEDKHDYFVDVADARYIVRRAFRIVEEQAKAGGIDPLAHQALIQIYGSKTMELPVNHVADRLDISPAFASSVVKSLVKLGYVTRRRDDKDQRVTFVSATETGIKLLIDIDKSVRFHVDYFTRQLNLSERENALSIMLFYVGLPSKGDEHAVMAATSGDR
ncbi:MAG: MarR family transcriptional regulator [Rhizobiaceae bacterium]